MKKLAVISSKGGVGKTTFSFHLSHRIAEMGKKVLTIDMDPQGSLSFVFCGTKKVAGVPALYIGQNVEPYRVRENLDFIPTDPEGGTITWSDKSLAQIIDTVISKMDKKPEWVIIDSPSSITLGTKEILDTVDSVVIPANLSTLALRGLVQLMKLNRKPWMILPMKVVKSQRNSKTGMNQLTDVLISRRLKPSEYILPSISRKVAVDYAMSVGKPVWQQTKYKDTKVVAEFDLAIETLMDRQEEAV